MSRRGQPPATPAAGRRRRRRRGEAGSGTAVGVAIMFPMLMLVIVMLQMLTESARIEQALQSTASRAAQTAALCCYYTGGPNGAEAVAHASLRSADSQSFHEGVACNNDIVADSSVLFIDVSENSIAPGPAAPVPPGGTVYVFVTCQLPPEALGGFGFPGFNAERTAIGIAVVDPYRYRPGA